MKALGKCLEHLGTILQRARWLHKVWKVPEAAGLSGRKDEAATCVLEAPENARPGTNPGAIVQRQSPSGVGSGNVEVTAVGVSLALRVRHRALKAAAYLCKRQTPSLGLPSQAKARLHFDCVPAAHLWW